MIPELQTAAALLLATIAAQRREWRAWDWLRVWHLVAWCCGTLLLRGPYAAYSISPYVDAHGEEDASLRRGGRGAAPLHLDPERMRQLSRLWASHAIGAEVVRERVMRERVIRESYY